MFQEGELLTNVRHCTEIPLNESRKKTIRFDIYKVIVDQI